MIEEIKIKAKVETKKQQPRFEGISLAMKILKRNSLSGKPKWMLSAIDESLRRRYSRFRGDQFIG